MKRSYTSYHKPSIKSNKLKFSFQESLLPFLCHFLKTGDSILQHPSLLSFNSGSEFTSWQRDGKTVTEFIFLGSKITADGDCSHEIKRCLLLGRKAMTNLDSVLKSRDITLPTKVHLVKAMVFPVFMYGCESWTIKKAEHQRIVALTLSWCWRRLLRVPWTSRRSNHSILKEISPEYSNGRTDAETPILWPSDAKNWLIGKDPDAGKDWTWEEKGATEDEMVG